MATKFVNGRKVLVDSQADPGSRKFLRESGGKQVTLADGTQLNALDSKNYGKTPTVLTNANILENKIPKLKNQVSQLPVPGQPTTQDGQPQEEGGFNFDEVLGLSKEKKDSKSAFASLRERQNTPDEQADPQFDQMMGLLAEQKKISDRKTQEDISRIESSMSRLKAEQMSANASGLAGVRNALGRAGASRYAPGGAAGAISGAASAGVRALADLNMQEQELISQARSAQETNDYRLLESKLGLIDQVRKDKAKAAEELGTTIRGQEIQASRDNALAGLVAQGVTDPVELLNKLNFDEQGNQVGDFTIEEVTGALKNLTESAGGKGAFKFEAKQIGPLLAANFTMEDITNMQNDLNSNGSVQAILEGIPPEMQDAVKTALGVDEATAANLSIGPGATDALTEHMIRTRLFPKAAAILNKGALSDSDRAVIDERIDFFRKNNLSEQQILDVFSGWSADVQSPYNDSFRDIVIANDKDGQGVSPALSQIGSLIANGNYKAAMNKVENTAMEKAKELDPESYMSTQAVETYTKRIDRIKQLLAKSTDYGNTGFLEGNFNKILGRLKGAEAQKIKSELTQLYQTFRKENAGVAVTDSEQRFLNDLFADINDPKGNFTVKLDTFQQGILDRYNSSRSVVSLPRVRVLDVLDPNEKLNLYGQSNASAFDSNQAGI